jgi:putative transposase
MDKTMASDPNGPPPRVEVISSVQRRRRFSTAEKVRLVEESMQPGMSVSLVARQAGISPSMLFNWRRRMLEGGFEAVQADEPVVGQTQVRDLEKRVRELERVAGTEDPGGRDPRGWGRRADTPGGGTAEKTDVAAAVMARAQGRFAMTTIASTPGVARSHPVERLARTSKPRGRYHKVEDCCLLPLIRQLVDERPSYGYRRITALLNRRLQGQELPKANAKRVLRILQNQGLVLQRHTGRQIGRTHDGTVVALTSDIRWCSDHFELTCRSGEIVRILFAIDACDREIVAWSATTAGIAGEPPASPDAGSSGDGASACCGCWSRTSCSPASSSALAA